MGSTRHFLFGPFRLDAENALLQCDTGVVHLPPKAFALLHYLVLHAGRLLTKDQLLDAVWQRRFISESALKGSINALRAALGDDPKAPRYIETVAKRGYRFIAEVRQEASEEQRSDRQLASLLAYRPWNTASAMHWVGRRRELTYLDGRLRLARQGKRQLAFVAGEAGIGKTTLIDVFLELQASQGNGVLRARCVEHYGKGEALMPLLEALEKRCRDERGQSLISRLRQHAPTCLMQMAALLSPEERSHLKEEVLGATEARMLREAAELLEHISNETPLIFVVDDLHWSDYATLDLISLLARRRTPARLLIIATYRPLDLILSNHPLAQVKKELSIRSLCSELTLNWLGEEDVKAYVLSRCPGNEVKEVLSTFIYRRTEGHPLFMVHLVDHLIERGRLLPAGGQWALAAREDALDLGLPDNLREMIETQVDRLRPEERQLLEAASAIGAEWSAALLSAISGVALEAVEACCDGLSRRGEMIRSIGSGECPDGTVAGRYAFRHALYSEVIYERLTPGRRMHLHDRIGGRLELAYGQEGGTIAAELALHFEQGRNVPKAIEYLRLAAEAAIRRYANREAVDYVNRALHLCEALPEPERQALILDLSLKRGVLKRSMNDMQGALEDFRVVRSLACAAGLRLWEVKSLMEQCRVLYWVDRPRCLALGAEAVQLSRELTDETMRVQVRGCFAGWAVNLQGWNAQDAEACALALQMARTTGDPQRLHYNLALQASLEFPRACYRTAIALTREGMEVARNRGDALQYLICEAICIRSLLHLGEWGEAGRHLAHALRMSERNDNMFAITYFTSAKGWLHELAFDYEGARRLCESALERIRDHGSANFFFALIRLGSAQLGLGHYAEAFTCFNRAERLLESSHQLMELYLRPLLHQGFSAHWLSQREFDKAEEQARKLRALAARPPDSTYLALAHRLLAEIAMARGMLREARAELGRALSALRKVEAPLAAWQVYATAAELNGRLDRLKEAEKYRLRSTAVLRGLAESLDGDDPLRETLSRHALLHKLGSL